MSMIKEELLKKIRERRITVGVVGLGYVGLPLAVEKAKAGFKTIGFDVQKAKVDMVSGLPHPAAIALLQQPLVTIGTESKLLFPIVNSRGVVLYHTLFDRKNIALAHPTYPQGGRSAQIGLLYLIMLVSVNVCWQRAHQILAFYLHDSPPIITTES